MGERSTSSTYWTTVMTDNTTPGPPDPDTSIPSLTTQLTELDLEAASILYNIQIEELKHMHNAQSHDQPDDVMEIETRASILVALHEEDTSSSVVASAIPLHDVSSKSIESTTETSFKVNDQNNASPAAPTSRVTRSGGSRAKARPEYDMSHHPIDDVIGKRALGAKGRKRGKKA